MPSILPYSNLAFYILSFVAVALVWLGSFFFKSPKAYKNILFLISLSYMGFFLPHKVMLASFSFLAYSYLVYSVSIKIKPQNYIYSALLLALPMILFKCDVGKFYRIMGISYVTFRSTQAMINAANMGRLNFVEFCTFLVFPFTLLAGPIDRSYRFRENLNHGFSMVNVENLHTGWIKFCWGVFFKFILSEVVLLYWMSGIDEKSTRLFDMLNMGYSYYFYLYFDFAGLSAMAVGLSWMLGIQTPENFDSPLLAHNPQNFWRRFHITLGLWLTDYFFKPIYKSLASYKFLRPHRLSVQNISLFLTFLLMGLWNGPKPYFIISGALFGLYSALHNTYVNYVRRTGSDLFKIFPGKSEILVKRTLMFHAAVLALYFFSGKVPL